MPKSKRHIVIFTSDTHGGSKFGFLVPGVETMEEVFIDGIPELKDTILELNPIQEYLFKIVDEGLVAVKKLIDKVKDTTVILIHNGDATQGNKHKSFLMNISENSQIDVGVGNLIYLAEKTGAHELHMVLGTESHVFEEGSSEKRIYKTLKDHFKGRFIGIYNHLLLTVQGLEIDVAHHGPAPGSRKWLMGNQMRWYLTNLFLQLQDKAPDVVVRSHVHVPQMAYITPWLGDKIKKMLGIITPAMQFIGMYARKVTRQANKNTIGFCAIEIVDGKIVGDVHWFTKSIDTRTKHNAQ